MRLNERFIQDLQERADIEQVISSYVNLKRRGKTLVGLCPFHNEKTPSFTVYPDTRSFYCFGCGAGGDVITFIMNAENLDYVDSLIHPGVLHYILDDIKETEENGASLYAGYVIEAALLLEAEYDRVCDKVWYIYVDENTRRKRLKESRGYSDEKIDSIMKNQLSDEEFESKCDYKIDNSFDIDHTRACIKKALEF